MLKNLPDNAKSPLRLQFASQKRISKAPKFNPASKVGPVQSMRDSLQVRKDPNYNRRTPYNQTEYEET